MSDRERSANIDMLRAVAAMMVLVAHAHLLAGPSAASRLDTSADQLVINNLSSGVWLFFALSGYLIPRAFLAALLEGTPLPRPTPYLVRRAARILPAYWIAFLVVTVLVVPGVAVHWWQYPLHLALLQNQVAGEGQNLYFVAWTLGIEALFYLAVPIGAYALRAITRGPVDVGRLAAVVIGVWMASGAWVIWAAHTYPNTGAAGAVANADVFRLNLLPMLSMFCPGMLVWLAETPQAATRGGLWAAYRAVVRRPWLALALAAALIVASAYAFASTSTVVFDLSKELWALSAGLLLATALQNWSWLRTPARLLAPIGLISYGIYLWHWVAVKWFQEHWMPLERPGAGPWLVHIAMLLAVALPAALLSWVLVERPLLSRTADWARRRGRRPEAGLSDATG
jgi:peptidoglycan/LPS O-acetylase OafA/YrhL